MPDLFICPACETVIESDEMWPSCPACVKPVACGCRSQNECCAPDFVGCRRDKLPRSLERDLRPVEGTSSA